jgi:hypothetical protein
MSETGLGPLDRAVLTAALSAPGTRGKIAAIAATILDGKTTTSALAKTVAAEQAFSEAGREGIAEALRLVEQDPTVAEQVRRLTRPEDTQ